MGIAGLDWDLGSISARTLSFGVSTSHLHLL